MPNELSEFDKKFLRNLSVSTEGVEDYVPKFKFEVRIEHVRAHCVWTRYFFVENKEAARDSALTLFYKNYPQVLKKSYPIRIYVWVDSRFVTTEQGTKRNSSVLEEFYPSGSGTPMHGLSDESQLAGKSWKLWDITIRTPLFIRTFRVYARTEDEASDMVCSMQNGRQHIVKADMTKQRPIFTWELIKKRRTKLIKKGGDAR